MRQLSANIPTWSTSHSHWQLTSHVSTAVSPSSIRSGLCWPMVTRGKSKEKKIYYTTNNPHLLTKQIQSYSQVPGEWKNQDIRMNNFTLLLWLFWYLVLN